jgi:hypothetical protein
VRKFQFKAVKIYILIKYTYKYIYIYFSLKTLVEFKVRTSDVNSKLISLPCIKVKKREKELSKKSNARYI